LSIFARQGMPDEANDNQNSVSSGIDFKLHFDVLDKSDQQNTSCDLVLKSQLYDEDSQSRGYVGNDTTGVPHEIRWDAMFDRLVAFKEEHGHCLVPNRYKEDPKLGAWVSTQRRQRKAILEEKFQSTILSHNRIERLNAIGFVWYTSDPRRVQWDIRYEQLKAFHRDYGKYSHMMKLSSDSLSN
jgi:phage pi2 protein 07